MYVRLLNTGILLKKGHTYVEKTSTLQKCVAAGRN